jgi:hypothetical protein
MFGCLFRVVHFFFEIVDAARVIFEGGAYFFFEVVDDDEVGEKGDEVFDAEEVDAAQEFNGGFDA